MKRLLQRDDFTAVFNALLNILSLWWGGMWLDVIKDMMGLKCDEVDYLLVLFELTELSSCRRCFTISITSEHSDPTSFNMTSVICRRWITSQWRCWNLKHWAHQHLTLWLCFVNWKKGKYSAHSIWTVAWRSEWDYMHGRVLSQLFKLSSKTSSTLKHASIVWRAW